VPATRTWDCWEYPCPRLSDANQHDDTVASDRAGGSGSDPGDRAGCKRRQYHHPPVAETGSGFQQVAEGDLEVQVYPRGDDEVAELTKSFNHMVTSLHESKMDLLKAYDSTLEGWSTALELRDRETEGHTQRVTDMTLRWRKRWEPPASSW
jgi:hypothetical protein